MVDFTRHPKFKILENVLKRPNKYSNIWEKITVSGIPNEYMEIAKKNINQFCYISTSVYTSDIQNYIDSLFVYDLSDINYSSLIKILSDNNFSKVDRVSERTEYSIRGDVITLWPSLYDNPIKISYFDEDIESIEMYDFSINLKITSLNYLIIGDEYKLEESNYSLVANNISKPINKKILFFDQFNLKGDINFDFKQPRLFFQRFDLLQDYIKKYENENYLITIDTKHSESIPNQYKKYLKQYEDIPSGIISNDLKVLILTDRELFGSIFLRNEINKNLSTTESRKMLAQFEGEVEIGDYIVHEDHGIGIYQGIIQEQASINDAGENNYIKIKYAESDELLVPLNMVYKITKYIGLEGEKPELTTLGKAQWLNITTKVKLSVKILASELIRHYAKLSLSKASVINTGDSHEFIQFCNDFEFQETPDQERSIQEVMKDLSIDKPMNRILIGDVGFGKTEVILRAAFKTVEAHKQVAILAPTTILAMQHFNVFSERFKKYNYKIGLLSRFSSKYENKDMIEKIKNNEIDIIIGTHRLLSNDVEFANMGLIVIDEEQKFGVKQKEKLKKLEYGVHVLTTTATPIPRTLSMALSTLQDISTIQTPPAGRKPVKIDVSKMDWNAIVDAIQFELKRKGQIYIVYNSVKTIVSIGAKLKRLIPDLKLIIAHGQMNNDTLEKVMYDFLTKRYDCLLCTTIIENGIDMKNVNTLIVIKAQNFGLSQLYQLKGRVGRSEIQAYSYFFYDGLDLNIDENELSEELKEQRSNKNYLKRLTALSEAQELGAGFDIATRDLEIRGAGNLLGKEQHGHINKIGFGLYMQMLAQEIERLKNTKD